MKLKKRTPQQPPCMVVDTFPFMLTFTKAEIEFLKPQITEIRKWGDDVIGEFIKTWAIGGATTLRAYFMTESDAVLFMVRWKGEAQA